MKQNKAYMYFNEDHMVAETGATVPMKGETFALAKGLHMHKHHWKSSQVLMFLVQKRPRVHLKLTTRAKVC